MSQPNERKSSLNKVRLQLPAKDEDLAKLKIGDVILPIPVEPVKVTLRTIGLSVISVPISPDLEPVTTLKTPAGMPARVASSPMASAENGVYRVGAVTATASFRFSQWMDDWFKMSGVKLIIGKGGMSSADYKKYFIPNRAIYLTTVGYGTGALLGRGIKDVKVYWLEELGIAQAIWVLDVQNFGPFLVESDFEGRSLFEESNDKVNQNIDDLYHGLKRPALARYGETTSRKDEVV